MIRPDAAFLRRFPHYLALDYYEAVLPVVKLKLATRILQHDDLSLFGQFILRSIDLDYKTPNAIAELLGVNIQDLADPGAQLLQGGLVTDGPTMNNVRSLQLTQKGKKLLDAKLKLMVPKKKTFHLHYDPLSHELDPASRDAIPLGDVRKEYPFDLPFNGQFPRIEDLDVSSVSEAVKRDPRVASDLQIVELIELDEPYVEYLPVQVFVLRHLQTNDLRLAVFHEMMYRERVSYELTRSLVRAEAVLPADVSERLNQDPDAQFTVQGSLGTPLIRLAKGTRQQFDAQLQVERREEMIFGTTSSDEREQLEREIAELQNALRNAEVEIGQARAQIEGLGNVSVRAIHTEEHRPLLFEALRSAASEIIITSPWMNTRTVDHGLCQAIRSATDRGVRVRVGFGFMSNTHSEQERNKAKNRAAIRALYSAVEGGNHELLEIIDLQSIHHKVLICDREYCVISSFNWLSYRGDQDEGFRQEVGCIISGEKEVKEIAAVRIQELDAGHQVPRERFANAL